MARIFATRDIGAEALALVRAAGHELEVWPELEPPPRSILLERVIGIAGLITTLSDRIDRSVLEAGHPDLRVVAQDAVGLDNIDLDAAAELGIAVTHAPEVLTEATAEFALFMLGDLARRLRASEELVRSGRWSSWHPFLPFLGDEVSGSTVAVVGLGRIGRAFAAKCTGLDVDLLLVSRRRDPEILQGLRAIQSARAASGLTRRAARADWASLGEALARADHLSLHCPLVREGPEANLGLIGTAELAAMKPTACLINTARGPLIDEGALAEAIRSGRLGGAALDVFEEEPLPRQHPFLDEALRDRLRLYHHFGSGTHQTRLSPDPERGMAGRTVAGLLDALSPSPTWRFAARRGNA